LCSIIVYKVEFITTSNTQKKQIVTIIIGIIQKPREQHCLVRQPKKQFTIDLKIFKFFKHINITNSFTECFSQDQEEALVGAETLETVRFIIRTLTLQLRMTGMMKVTHGEQVMEETGVEVAGEEEEVEAADEGEGGSGG
jgi:hypothetical protein